LIALEYNNPNAEQPEGWYPRVRKIATDGKVTTLVTLSANSDAPFRLR
jgi:hypothetical protein